MSSVEGSLKAAAEQGAPELSVDGFSTRQIEASTALMKAQPAWLGWVAGTTAATRGFARQQIVAMQLAYVVAVLAILASELPRGHVERWLLWTWLGESAANLALRVGLFARMLTRDEPATMVRSRFLRLVPLTSNLNVGCHWVWTVYLFVGPNLDATLMIIVGAFVMLSVAAVSISAASPITAVLYPCFLWAPLGIAVAGGEWARGPVVAALTGVVVMTVAVTYFTVTVHVRKYLVKSDEVGLLLARLRRTNDDLEHTNSALDAHRREAQAELEARSEYFSEASHDFKQRLHALKLLSASMTDRGFPADDLRRAVEDLEAFLTQILEFAQCEHVAKDPTLERVELQAIFQQLNVHFEDIAEARRIELRFRTTGVELVGDRLMLTRILENLLSNAIKHSPHQGKVLVVARRRCGELWVEVRDQGPGIPIDAQHAVFKPFYQLRYYSRHLDGVGLGLTIVERLTRALGYTMTVRSVEGRGSLFRIVVPAP